MTTRKGGPKAPPRVTPNKFLIALKHKNMDVFKFDSEAEEDKNYISASERFMEFQTQLGMVVHHTTQFRKTLEDSLQQAVELADDFSRLAAGQGGERAAEPWAKEAGEQAFLLKGMLEESVVSLRRHLCDDLDEKMMRELKEECASFEDVHARMVSRSNMKIESFHYANKVQDLKGKQKATDEKKDRNKEKYASASQGLRDQTNQLMATFARAEQVRGRLLTQDLPAVILAKRNAFDSFAINLNNAAAKAADGEPRPPRMSDAARIPQRVMPSSDFPGTPPNKELTVVSLDDEASGEEPPAYSSPSPVRVAPPASVEVTQTIVKKRSPLPMTPKEDGAPWSGSGGTGGEFGDELKRAHEHQNSKMAAESAAAAATTSLPSTPKGATDSVTSVDAARSPTPHAESSPGALASGGGGGGGATGFSDSGAAAEAAGAAAAAAEAATPTTAAAVVEKERPESTTTTTEEQPPPEEESPARNGGGTPSPIGTPTPGTPESSAEKSVAAAEEPEKDGDAAGAGGGGGEEEEGELEPGKHRLRALYDYEATEDGDLSFRAGDMIISDEGAFSGSGWASGQCHGNNGNFPANYTEPW